ncbi:hexokinase [Coemansia sp. RSA 2618]|nr:hexokinase [Coemansia sp. RSA 2618]
MLSSYTTSSLLSGEQQSLLNHISESFTVSDEQLSNIVTRVHAELYRGLSRSNGGRASELLMGPTFVHQPTALANTVSLGMAIEATGKRIRIGSVHFGTDNTVAHKHTQVFTTPATDTRSAAHFFEYVAFCLREFLQQHGLERHGQSLPLGVTIGLPVDSRDGVQCSVAEVAKEDSLDLCGSNVGRRLCDAVLRSHLPVHITSVTNNVVSSLVAARFADKSTRVAATFNHGINAAYFEQLGNVERLHSAPQCSSSDVAINTEIGRFGSKFNALPLTMWDRRVDRESRSPRSRALEKLVADQYLGEIVRSLVTDFIDRQLLFAPACEVREISVPYSFHTAYMAPIIEDASGDLQTVDAVFAAEFGISCSPADRLIIRTLCEIVATRAARISGAVLAALVLKASAKSSTEPVAVALGGVLFDVNPRLLDDTVATMKKLLLANTACVQAEIVTQGRGDDLVGAAVNAACVMN